MKGFQDAPDEAIEADEAKEVRSRLASLEQQQTLYCRSIQSVEAKD